MALPSPLLAPVTTATLSSSFFVLMTGVIAPKPAAANIRRARLKRQTLNPRLQRNPKSQTPTAVVFGTGLAGSALNWLEVEIRSCFGVWSLKFGASEGGVCSCFDRVLCY